MTERQQRIAAIARNRNMMLLWLGYKQRFPECELHGEVARPETRRAYLTGVPHAFTKSGRSFIIWDAKRKAWALTVEASWWPRNFSTKRAALAKGRAVEAERDAYARSEAARWVARQNAWMRTPDWQHRFAQMRREESAERLAVLSQTRNF